jgi:hypothetical protein
MERLYGKACNSFIYLVDNVLVSVCTRKETSYKHSSIHASSLLLRSGSLTQNSAKDDQIGAKSHSTRQQPGAPKVLPYKELNVSGELFKNCFQLL